jgi:arsenite methyltransferase
MLWDSKIGKLRSREHLLRRITWTGEERVLDVGCGRGLMLIGVAKRLTTGMATGIDIWQTEDLSGNRPEATLENARREGVLDRIEVRTGDMRQIPFADNTFDVVVSRAAIHNLYETGDRAQAISEIARVHFRHFTFSRIASISPALQDEVRRGARHFGHSPSSLRRRAIICGTWHSPSGLRR